MKGMKGMIILGVIGSLTFYHPAISPSFLLGLGLDRVGVVGYKRS